METQANQLELLRGGQAGFEPFAFSPLSTLSTPRAFAVAQLDQDVEPELVVTQSDVAQLTIFNKAALSFDARSFALPDIGLVARAADLNGDGLVDLLVATKNVLVVLRATEP